LPCWVPRHNTKQNKQLPVGFTHHTIQRTRQKKKKRAVTSLLNSIAVIYFEARKEEKARTLLTTMMQMQPLQGDVTADSSLAKETKCHPVKPNPSVYVVRAVLLLITVEECGCGGMFLLRPK
jgi:hypothetical protein